MHLRICTSATEKETVLTVFFIKNNNALYALSWRDFEFFFRQICLFLDYLKILLRKNFSKMLHLKVENCRTRFLPVWGTS